MLAVLKEIATVLLGVIVAVTTAAIVLWLTSISHAICWHVKAIRAVMAFRKKHPRAIYLGRLATGGIIVTNSNQVMQSVDLGLLAIREEAARRAQVQHVYKWERLP